MTCLTSSPCFCLSSLLHVVSMICTCQYKKPTEDDLCWCCCMYNYLDTSAPEWAVGTVGCIKFSEDRTPEEQKYVEKCNQCIHDVVCCPCNTCDWIFNLSCIKYIADACVNLNQSCHRCVGGTWSCVGLICNRVCNTRPEVVTVYRGPFNESMR